MLGLRDQVKGSTGMHKQVLWQSTTEGLSARGRQEILARYRALRRRGVDRHIARMCSQSAAHGVWMAKEGGW